MRLKPSHFISTVDSVELKAPRKNRRFGRGANSGCPSLQFLQQGPLFFKLKNVLASITGLDIVLDSVAI